MRASTRVVLAVAVALSACCTSPWRAFPDMPSPPDSSFRTGGPAGYDVYIWECLDGQRTVVFKYTAEMSCKEPEMQTAPCGGVTAIEKELAGTTANPVPENLAWPE